MLRFTSWRNRRILGSLRRAESFAKSERFENLEEFEKLGEVEAFQALLKSRAREIGEVKLFGRSWRSEKPGAFRRLSSLRSAERRTPGMLEAFEALAKPGELGTPGTSKEFVELGKLKLFQTPGRLTGSRSSEPSKH